MRYSWRLSLGTISVTVLTLGMVLSGCGTSRTTGAGRVTAKSTATPTATLMPFPTESPPTPSLTDLELSGCPKLAVAYMPSAPQYNMVGALKISVPQRTRDYPSESLPGNIPNAPYQIPASAVNSYAPSPPVNPRLSSASGYIIQVCNQTSASHTLTSLSVNIASFSPSSGPTSVWHVCQDGPYDAAIKQTIGGCGGGMGGAAFLTATLPGDRAGASAAATTTTQYGGPNLPIRLDPNKSLVIVVGVGGLTSQGTYALSFSISADGAAPVTLNPSDGAFLMAPSATVWTGTACQTPAMRAQIPAATQDTFYVCPPSS